MWSQVRGLCELRYLVIDTEGKTRQYRAMFMRSMSRIWQERRVPRVSSFLRYEARRKKQLVPALAYPTTNRTHIHSHSHVHCEFQHVLWIFQCDPSFIPYLNLLPYSIALSPSARFLEKWHENRNMAEVSEHQHPTTANESAAAYEDDPPRHPTPRHIRPALTALVRAAVSPVSNALEVNIFS